MGRTVVVTDSVSCLPPELLSLYSIYVVPLLIIHDGRSYRDGIDISPTEVYRIMRKKGVLPTTSVPSPADILGTYLEASEKGESILCITVTGLQSKVYDTALLAKEMAKTELPGTTIEVMDSRAVAGALGFIVLAAAQAAHAGGSLDEVREAAESMVPRVNTVFALDTLYYLARTGRIGRAAAWAGVLLDMKPVVEHPPTVGETIPVARPRTKSKAVSLLLKIMAERVGDSPVHAVVHHGDDLEAAERLRDRVASQFNCVDLYLSDFPPAMGVHAGPGLLGISFYAE
ncbi:MAG: DegV family protein [Chloroflexota bacterium]|nr:DegV family protein [Chloroflexota bacterium]